jgi:hypothetical protein
MSLARRSRLRRDFPQRHIMHDWALERRALAREHLAEIKHRLKCVQLLRILQRAPRPYHALTAASSGFIPTMFSARVRL